MLLKRIKASYRGRANGFVIVAYNPPLSEEEAAEIIRRVEAHDGLVKACREALLGWNEFVKVEAATIKAFYKRLEIAEQALKDEPK